MTASRVHFSKQLKKASPAIRSEIRDPLCFYRAIVRPVLEYVCPVWHSSLTVTQSDVLDSTDIETRHSHDILRRRL